MSTRVVVFGVRCRLVGVFRPLHLRLAPGQFQPPQRARHPTSRVLGSARMETTPDTAVTSVLKTTKRPRCCRHFWDKRNPFNKQQIYKRQRIFHSSHFCLGNEISESCICYLHRMLLAVFFKCFRRNACHLFKQGSAQPRELYFAVEKWLTHS